MKTVMIFGTFDGIHQGHLFFIQYAKNKGDRLVVVVARDETVSRLKGYLPQQSLQDRCFAIEQLHIADEVIPGSGEDHFSAIQQYQPNHIILGYDQTYFADTLQQDLRQKGFSNTTISRAPSYFPEKYKSSILQNRSM